MGLNFEVAFFGVTKVLGDWNLILLCRNGGCFRHMSFGFLILRKPRLISNIEILAVLYGAELGSYFFLEIQKSKKADI